MIRNTVVNTVNYFYPLGNTPAVSLTQDLPLEIDADILLLGCGDARNVLFTCFADPSRRLDITCCDVEPAIIARNILLYTLFIDDVNSTRLNQIWNIYYHWKIDSGSTNLFESQVDKLLSISETASQWRASTYGSTLRFCDDRTLRKVRQFWQRCSSKGLSELQKSHRQSHFRHSIEKARKLREKILGTGVSLAGVRSAAPTGIFALNDLSAVAAKWWDEGTTSFNTSFNLNSKQFNPTFLASTNQSLILHYGTDPLLGFPLATAYVPLSDNSNLHAKKDGVSAAEYLAVCAREHFREWAEGFRKAASQKSVLRFCVADALTLSLTLKNARSFDEDGLTASLFCDNWTSELLILDGNEYSALGKNAPRTFDVVDTSNLIDHLGPLNLVPACTALLKDKISSTAYTETLVQQDSSERERVAGLLGGEVRTIALLLGVSPVEMWTNATNSPEDEAVLDVVNDRMGLREGKSATQVRSRLRWKRIFSSEEISAPTISVQPSGLAQILVQLYDHMFQHEDIRSLLTNFDLKSFSKRSSPFYSRASFVVLLRTIQKTIITNWDECLDQMKSQILSRLYKSSIGANFWQELLLYMHMLGVCTTELPDIDLNASQQAKMAPFFGMWRHIPTQACITIRVPRAKLHMFSSRAGISGTPTMRCDIEGKDARSNRPWSNIFTSVTVAFGEADVLREDGIPKLKIIGDESAWFGQSDMFVSTLIPTWTILQADEITPTVKCGLLATPQSCLAFREDLGLTLDIFTAEITSEAIIVSEFLPTMSSLPRLADEELSPPLNLPCTVTALLSSEGAISTLVLRRSLTSDAEKSGLKDRSLPIQVHFPTTFRGFIQIGDKIKLPVEFPVPIDQARHKIRIARTSSYIEIEAPVWNPLTETSSIFLFPIIPPSELSKRQQYIPVPWTTTRVSLDGFPVVELADKKRIQWLITHGSIMFSNRERKIREANMAGHPKSGANPNVRVEMKEGIFSMLMAYTALQGHHATVFGLSKEVGGINVLFLTSCLRLDLVNRTVVLDAAAIPLTDKMKLDGKARSFFQSLIGSVMQIRVSDEELRSWKSVLPALAERCRIWKHGASCEYTTTNEIPIIKALSDGHSPLCSCGIGKFPASYLKVPKFSNVQYMLKQYATRIAISPVFALPYVEDCFLVGQSAPENLPAVPAIEGGCGNCGVKKRTDTSAGEGKLLVCARCRRERYCSVKCQRANWKSHKQTCVSS